MEGERNDNPGYMVRRQIFAVGYMKGLLDTIRARATPGRTDRVQRTAHSGANSVRGAPRVDASGRFRHRCACLLADHLP